MTSKLTFIKGQQRLNKLASGDYDNVEPWRWCEAFNSFQTLFARFRIKQAESDKTVVGDINHLLSSSEYKTLNKNLFYETSTPLPNDFLNWSRISITAKKGTCEKSSFKLYPVEEANVSVYLTNANKKPSFEWAETFYTLVGKRIRVYTNGEFSVPKTDLIYYRKPKDIVIEGIENENGVLMSAAVNPEWNDDTCEIIIRGAVALISGDIEYLNKYQISNQDIQLFT